MVMICHCRGITDKDLESAFHAAKARKLSQGEPQISVADTVPDLGEFSCGGCSRIFQRAAAQFNESGAIHLFKRSKAGEQGLCATAASRDYKFEGIPNLRNSAIEGAEL